MNKLIIFPFNGNAIEAMDCVSDQYELIAFADDTLEKQGVSEFGIPVSSRDIIHKYPEALVLAVPGSPASFRFRKKVIDSLGLPLHKFAKIIHPSASISKNSIMGYNLLIMAGAVINNKASLGNHICILPNTVVHHDSSISNYTLVGSSVVIAGNTHIGENCYIGSGSNIINGIRIGDGTIVGMGSNVLSDIKVNAKVVGNPAKYI